MTTPNQPLPDTVEKLLGTGAFQVGGSGTKFGQEIDATAVASSFYIEKPTQDNKVEVFSQAMQMLSPDALSSFSAVIPDWEDGDEQDPVTVTDKLFGNLIDKPTVQNVWDDLVNGLFGWLGVGWGRDVSQEAIQDTAAAMAALAAQVQALQNTQTAAGNSGNSEIVSFSGRANSTSIGADFSQTYAGSGSTLTWGITNGQVAIQGPQSNNPRTCIAIYNAKQTLTDYQTVGTAFASAPFTYLFTTSYNLLIARANAAGTSYVYALMDKNDVELGCVVSGVRTVWSTASFSFKSTGVYWLEAGTVGGARVFRVLEGSSPIITHTEVGTTSQMGALYRYTGMGVDVDASSGGGTTEPGIVTAFGFSDNTPPLFLGSGAFMYRTATASIGMSSGLNLLPTNFFGVVGENTSDITCNASTGRFTVSLPGWYTIHGRARTSGSFLPNGVTWVLYKNGSPHRYGGAEHTRGVNSSNFAYIPQGWQGSWTVYLVAGDYVELGYDSTSAVSNVMQGEATGRQTYFSIALANKSLA